MISLKLIVFGITILYQCNRNTAVPVDGYKIVCYYTNWSKDRPAPGTFTPENIPPYLCTHVIFAFAGISNNQLTTTYKGDIDLYARIQNLKQSNPQLKTLLAVGGGNYNPSIFSQLASDYNSRLAFANNAISYLENYGFDGLDMDWEYPDGDLDKYNFVLLLQDIQDGFINRANQTGNPRLLLTAAVSASNYQVNRGYDIPNIHPYVDFINLMTYDYHGPWNGRVGHNAPLYPPANDDADDQKQCVSFGASLWADRDTPTEKLIIGMPTYAVTFTLADPNQYWVNSPSAGVGNEGPITKSKGLLAYYEVCTMLQNGANYIWDWDMQVPYAVQGNQWIGFDDVRSIQNKMSYIKDNGFGGAMVWDLDFDDFSGTQCTGNVQYPLISTMRNELQP